MINLKNSQSILEHSESLQHNNLVALQHSRRFHGMHVSMTNHSLMDIHLIEFIHRTHNRLTSFSLDDRFSSSSFVKSFLFCHFLAVFCNQGDVGCRSWNAYIRVSEFTQVFSGQTRKTGDTPYPLRLIDQWESNTLYLNYKVNGVARENYVSHWNRA